MVAEERREKQMKTSIKTQKKQYNEKVKTFICVPLRSPRLCVGKETEIFIVAGYVYLRLRCYAFLSFGICFFGIYLYLAFEICDLFVIRHLIFGIFYRFI